MVGRGGGGVHNNPSGLMVYYALILRRKHTLTLVIERLHLIDYWCSIKYDQILTDPRLSAVAAGTILANGRRLTNDGVKLAIVFDADPTLNQH